MISSLFPPDEYACDRRPSLWLLQKVLTQALCQAVLQLRSIQQLLLQAPRLLRFFVDSPRKRPSQAAEAASAAQEIVAGLLRWEDHLLALALQVLG